MYRLLKKAFTDIKNLKSSKQTKEWVKIAEGYGPISYDADKYNELLLVTYFGGVNIDTFIPVITLTDAARTHFVGTYSTTIYVKISKTTMSVSIQPAGYTAELILYGR